MAATDDLDELVLQHEQLKSLTFPTGVVTGLAVAAVVGLLANSAALGVVGWMGTWLIGTRVVSQAAPALGTAPLVKYPLFLCCAMPFLSLVVPIYLWPAMRSRKAELEAAIRQLQLRERRRGPAAPAPAPAEAPAPEKAPVEQALPVLRGVVREALAEGKEIQLRVTSTGAGGQVPAGAEMPPARATQGVFVVGYHVDAGPVWTSVDRAEIRAAGLDLDSLHRRALGNLMKLVKGQPGLKLIDHPPYYGLRLDGDHEACLVLLEGLWDQLFKDKTPNGAVVAIPTRDVLAFCDANSAEGVAALRANVARFGPDAKGAVFQGLLLRRDGRWRVMD